MNEFPYNYQQQSAMPVAQRVTQVMKRVYVKMFLALLVTAACAFYASTAGFVDYMAQHSWVYWGMFIAMLGIVFGLSAGIQRMKSSTATAVFYLFAVLMGLSLSTIFIVYSGASLFKTFLITAGVFGAMSVYGFTTGKDLSRFGSFMVMALFGLIIASVINIFMHSTQLEWIISFAGVIIFIGLTAWDTQQVKRMAEQMPESTYGHLATIGALSLYLDFINLFLYLLRFFGSSRD